MNIIKTDFVVSVLNSKFLSITEELALRVANKVSDNTGYQHRVFLLRSPFTESSIIKEYVEKLSDDITYFNSFSSIKESIRKLNPSKIVCEENIASNFKNSITVESRNYRIEESILSGDFETFKRYVFNNLREMDCRYLFNLVRETNDLEPITNKIDLPKNVLREKYHSGEIFNTGDTVSHKDKLFEILDRGSNYLVVVNETGEIKKVWIDEASVSDETIKWGSTLSENEISYKGYETKNFHKIDPLLKEDFLSLIEKSEDSLIKFNTIKLMDQFILSEDKSILDKLKINMGKLREDVMSADFKTGEDGKKHRARRITFANKVNGKKDSSEKEDEDDEDKDKKVKEDFDTKLEYHEVLNPKLWDQDKLISIVKERLCDISTAFEEFLDKDGKIIEVLDVIITGSNCNYNYTPQSDIDLHLIVNLDDIEDKELMAAFLTAKKTIWKSAHDITIKGYDVELYAQDKNDNLVATGMYSIRNDKWLKKPEYLKLDINHFTVQAKAKDIANQIEDILSIQGENTTERIDCIKEKIRKMRSSGLSKGGEFSVENLAFKALRNNGYFEKINNMKKKIVDKKLSLESFVVMDKNRIDNGSSGIANAGDIKKLVKKLKTPIGHTLGSEEHLRIRKIKYSTE